MCFSSFFLVTVLASGVAYAVEEAPTTVRTFAGMAISTEVQKQYPSVATIIEDDTGYRCHFIFFENGRPIPVVATVAKSDATDTDQETTDDEGASGEPVVFTGRVRDPRGFTITWMATLRGDTIIGTYQQPVDKGSFTLVDQYP